MAGFADFEVWAVDLDGCILELDEYPRFGSPVPYVKDALTLAKEMGYYIIINTCREGENLRPALECLMYHKIPFDSVNQNYPPWIDRWGECRKISATRYFDDRNWRWSHAEWADILFALQYHATDRGSANG